MMAQQQSSQNSQPVKKKTTYKPKKQACLPKTQTLVITSYISKFGFLRFVDNLLTIYPFHKFLIYNIVTPV